MPRARPDATVLAAIPERGRGITKRAIEKKLGMTRQTVWRVITRLHATGKCHIAGWYVVPTGGPFSPRYIAGPGNDAPCTLTPQSPAESQRRYREKAMKTGAWAIRSEKVSAKYRRDKSIADPNTRWLAMLLV